MPTTTLVREPVVVHRFSTSEFMHMHELLHTVRPAFRGIEFSLAAWFLSECLRDESDLVSAGFEVITQGSDTRMPSGMAVAAACHGAAWLVQIGFLERPIRGDRGRASSYRVNVDWNPSSLVESDWPRREQALSEISMLVETSSRRPSRAVTRMVA